MPRAVKLVDQRILVMKMVLEIMRIYCRIYFKSRRFGACAEEMMLLGAVFVGQSEGRPMNPSKLAEFAGIARPTVIRKLKRLEDAGLLERCPDGSLMLMRSIMNNDEAVRAAVEIRKLVVSTAGRLSKLDTQGIATRQCPSI